jgi:hypothetical protein
MFAVPQKAPQALTLGLAMASLGEFSFIVGSAARNDLHLMTDETYAAVTLAVLFTIVVSPTLLSMVLGWSQRRAEAEIARAAQAAAAPGGVVYYKLDIKVLNRWGLVADILRLLNEANVEVIEFRVDLRGDFALYEAYLKDNKLRAPRPGDVAFAELPARLMELRTGLVRGSNAHARMHACNGWLTQLRVLRAFVLVHRWASWRMTLAPRWARWAPATPKAAAPA